MYDINDTVLYGSHGVCKIVDITEKEMDKESRRCYVLKPMYEGTFTIFVPIDSKNIDAKMRRVLSTEEIHALIEAMPGEDIICIENDTARREKYKEILAGGDRTQLVKLIKTLYSQQQQRKEQGKKPLATDENFLKDAERILYDELAHVLDIQREQVLPFIIGQIGVDERKTDE
ncbi:MAG: CarD family transcriptional regulator [Clostridiales bacterium]|jgi:CarD family transcriptional regulator|nr:CarD family transcriptional regulator [Clostridiales bacterium]